MSKRFNIFIAVCVLISVTLYFVEVSMGYENSLVAFPLFIWAERLLAGIFTLEIFLQWRNSNKYIGSGDFWIDLLAVIPFWIGFFVPPQALGLIRSLRVLRLFKLFWLLDSFKILTRTFQLAWPSFKAAGMVVIAVCLLGAAMLFQIEPETFGNIGNAVWFAFTSATTIGYGDYSPVTALGKIVTMCILYGPALLVCGTVVGVIGSAYTVAYEEYEAKK